MDNIHGKVSTHQSIGGKVTTKSAVNGELDNDVKDRIIKDYNQLRNKPSVNGVVLQGDKTSADLGIVYSDTVEGWNAQSSLITVKDAIYIYTDYAQDGEGNNIPGIKIGDGMGYLIDAPFVDKVMQDHILNTIVHITSAERQFWNDKVRCYIDANDAENVVFTTN